MREISMAEVAEMLPAYIEEQQRLAPIKARILNPSNRWDRFAALRDFYSSIDVTDFEPYPLDWPQIFTPIEDRVWGDLRCEGIDMWPQYPVGRYFLDFADPICRIAIECDGKDWHQGERDTERDAELLGMGWRVYRARGYECNRCWEPDWDIVRHQLIDSDGTEELPEVLDWLHGTSEGLVAAISIVHYGRKHRFVTLDEARKALTAHTLQGAA